MTAGRLLEWIGELFRANKRRILIIFIGGGRINKIYEIKEKDLK